MVLVMPASPVDRTSDRPAYKQVADRLRERLDSGELRLGDRFPSETELIDEFGVSRSTVRDGLKVLINEGRAEALRGKGVFVREPVTRTKLIFRDPVSVLAASVGGRRRAMKDDAHDQGFGFRQELVDLGEVEADSVIAQALAVEPGTTVFTRQRIVRLRRPGTTRFEIAKLVDSYYPLDCVTPVLRSRSTGTKGVHGAVASAGNDPTRYEESVSFRMPTPAEAGRLRLTAGVPVIEQVRVAFVEDRRVECLFAVSAGDKYELEYRIPVR
jgi:GntR family transcriptional regulator